MINKIKRIYKKFSLLTSEGFFLLSIQLLRSDS